MNNLSTINKLTAAEVFNGNNAESLISDIEKEVRSFVPDVSTAKTRKDIASLAAKVSKSKVFLDGLGKDLVAGWKSQAKVVDNERKLVRDRLDILRDETRKPLTDYETEEKDRAGREFLAKQIAECHEQAFTLNELFDLKNAEEAREANQLRIEAERVAKEEGERIELERIERERQIAIDAAETAKREAEDLAAKEKAEAEQKVIDAKAAIELEKLKAKEAAEKAERDKIQAVKDAELKASKEAAQKESDRIAKEAAKLAEEKRLLAIEEKKSANKRHQASVNNKILKQFSALGISEDDGKKIITAIARLEFDYVSINY